MRRKILLVALVILGSLTVFAPRASAALSISVNFFYDDLAPHGHWFRMENYGWVWTPRHVAVHWRPYTLGHWAYSDDYGWVWVSDEDFGWATYHYGRWFYDGDYGWVWVPGDQWAPAWVSWRSGGGYVGWAPLPPEYDWRVSLGFHSGGAAGGLYLGPAQYVFVPERHVSDPGVYRYAVPYDRNGAIVPVTRDVTRYETVGDRIVNRAVPVRDVELAAGRSVPRYRVEAALAGPRRTVVQGNTVRVFHPSREAIAQAPAPRTAPPPTAFPTVRPRPAAPPANPRGVRLQRPPTATPNRGEVARPGAQQHSERQRQQQARQQRQEQVRQQQVARQQEAQQRRQQAQAERQQQEQRAQALREQQAARRLAQQQREQQKRQQQAKKEPKQPGKPQTPVNPNG